MHPQPETYWGNVNPIGPRGVYDEAKRYAEAMTMAYHRQQGVDTAIVRIFNTYGPRMRAHDGRAIPTFVRQALENKPLTVFGDGSQTRSFCYVDDLIRGLYLLAMSDEHLPVNLGNPREFTILELAETVIRVTGSTSEIVFEALPVDDPQGAPARHHPREAGARLGAGDRARRRPPTNASRPWRTGPCVSDSSSFALVVPPHARLARRRPSRREASSSASTTSSRSRQSRLGVPAVRLSSASRRSASTSTGAARAASPGVGRRTRSTRPIRPTTGAIYDAFVKRAAENRIKVVFSILGTPTGRPRRGEEGEPRARPDADLQNFAFAPPSATAERFRPTPTAALPRVRFWLAWNEPNNPVFLFPQFRYIGGRRLSRQPGRLREDVQRDLDRAST